MHIDAEMYLEQFRVHPSATVVVGAMISLMSLVAMVPYFAFGNPQRFVATVGYYSGAAGLTFLAACGIALTVFGLRFSRGA